MNKMNYSKNAWEDETGVGHHTRSKSGQKQRVLPWRSYFSRRQQSQGLNQDTVRMMETAHNTPTAHTAFSPSFSAARRLQPKEDKDINGENLLAWFLRPLPFSLSLAAVVLLGVIGFSGFLTYQSKSAEVQGLTLDDIEVPQKSVSPKQRWQNWKSGLSKQTDYLKQNESLVILLKRYGLSQQQSSDLVMSVGKDVDLTHMRTEDPIQLFFSDNGERNLDTGDNQHLVGFQVGSREKTVNAYLYQGAPKNEIIYHELTSKTFSATVEVTRSLYQDGTDQGIPGGILLDMFNRYSFDINFQSDIQRGTRYELVYTMIFNEDNEVVGTGDILYANITLADGSSFPIFEYIDLAGKSEFFNPRGRSVNKALLLMPVNGAYVSSTFGYRRDPILGTWRLHRGTDYAVPTGTPIKAGGTGRIIVRGWSRVGYGYHIIIRHNNGYDTLYGHMSRFRPGLHVGSHVQQGDIIGYVGSTGKSTGPHVHYEVRRYNKPVSLRSLHLQSSRDLNGMDLYLFKRGLRALQTRFHGMLPDLDKIQLSVDLAQRSTSVSFRGGIGGTN